jgi:benzodiazapine receptor
MSKMASGISLLAWVGVCFAAAALGSAFSAQSVGNWYGDLAKPAWTPPSGIFGPVWSVLYLMMGVAAWLVWRKAGPGSALALALFGVQLALNVAWSALFFGLRSPGAAFAEIVVLWALILATLLAFRRVTPVAGYLLMPYQAWVTFAAALNFAIWRMNL